MPDDHATIRRLLGAVPVEPLDPGLDHRVYAVGDRLVARFGDRAVEEAALLAAIAPRLLLRVPVPVPVPVVVDAAAGCMVLPRVPGRPLLEIPRAERRRFAPLLLRFAEAVHALDVEAPEADDTPEAWLEEAHATWARVRDEVPEGIEPRLVAPPPAARKVFIHGDLGAEHVFADGGRITGVIDWGDAALGDPAIDHGRLMRDLGVDGDERARFYALCTAIEDLAFGLETGRDAYRDNALAALAGLTRSA